MEERRTDICQGIFQRQALNLRLHSCGRYVPLEGDQVRHDAGDKGSSLKKIDIITGHGRQNARVVTTLTCDVPDLVAVAVSLVLDALMMFSPGAKTPMAEP